MVEALFIDDQSGTEHAAIRDTRQKNYVEQRATLIGDRSGNFITIDVVEHIGTKWSHIRINLQPPIMTRIHWLRHLSWMLSSGLCVCSSVCTLCTTYIRCVTRTASLSHMIFVVWFYWILWLFFVFCLCDTYRISYKYSRTWTTHMRTGALTATVSVCEMNSLSKNNATSNTRLELYTHKGPCIARNTMPNECTLAILFLNRIQFDLAQLLSETFLWDTHTHKNAHRPKLCQRLRWCGAVLGRTRPFEHR